MCGHKFGSSKQPFQDACKNGCGFEDRFRDEMRDHWGITTEWKSFGAELGEFERTAKHEIQKGTYPLFTTVSMIAVQWDTGIIAPISHTFVVIEENGSLVFLTRTHGDDRIIRVPWEKMWPIHGRGVGSALYVDKSRLADALFYTVPDIRR